MILKLALPKLYFDKSDRFEQPNSMQLRKILQSVNLNSTSKNGSSAKKVSKLTLLVAINLNLN